MTNSPKKKIIVLCDHPLATSGVGVQARFLIEGLLKTGKYSFRCLGGALKHSDYTVTTVTPDFIIRPVDGFGNKEMIRNILATERPDAVFLFTDPRQFTWLWEMEDEVHQVCPITYWHVWDNDPYPAFNKVWYEGTDVINCLSYKTYEMVQPNFPNKTNYIPHCFPKEVYFAAKEEEIAKIKHENFGDKADWFTPLWVNRNAGRKMPSDVMEAWKLFLDKLEAKHGHRKAFLIMHTDPNDPEGPNLMAVSEMLGTQNNIWYSTEKLDFNQMNLLHNITDCCINIANNEGFGLSALISLMVGKPNVALMTGGLSRQLIDHRNGFELGAAIKPVTRKLTGSQMVPYIYQDYASQEDVANGLMKIYEMTDKQKAEFKVKAADYVASEFNYGTMVSEWDRTLTESIDSWKTNKASGQTKKWSLTHLDPSAIKKVDQQPPRPATAPPVAPPVITRAQPTVLGKRATHPKILEKMRESRR